MAKKEKGPVTTYIITDDGENAFRAVDIENAGDADVNVDEILAPYILDLVDSIGVDFQAVRVHEVIRSYDIKATFTLQDLKE